MNILFYVISGLLSAIGFRWLYLDAKHDSGHTAYGYLLIASALFAIAGVLA